MGENMCKVCGEKLQKKEDNAIYYCLKCAEEKKKKDNLLNQK